jgi:hypothetical protein
VGGNTRHSRQGTGGGSGSRRVYKSRPLERHGDQRQRRIIETPTTLTIFGTIRHNKGKMSNNGFVPKYTHPFTLEEAMLLEINILVQGKLS